jgi:hypothetical protein
MNQSQLKQTCKWCKREIVACRNCSYLTCSGHVHFKSQMHYCGGIKGQPNAKASPGDVK